MDTNRKTPMQVSHLCVALTLALLFSAMPSAGQTTAPTPSRDNDTTNWQLSSADRFLDSHPEIAEQLHKDPSLINNKQFVQNHPALQQYLQEHPAVREEFSENPNAFMRQEQRYDRQEDRSDNAMRLRELGSADRFLDSHPEIAEQLRKDPSLINNKQFVQNHPALQQYLQEHPAVREEFSENPNAFMQQEQRYDRREDAQNVRDPGRDSREVTNFGDFLRGHSAMADQLARDPSLANKREYLESHPELQNYLKEHPIVQQRLWENPLALMTSPALAGWVPKVTTSTPPLKPDAKQ